jgi:ABC-2 type transport system permease protein
MSIVRERSKNSLALLLAKPLYRRDVVVGKFMGLSLFLLFFVAFNVALNIFMIILFFEVPAQMGEFLLRIFSFILVLFVECSLALAVMMLAGVVLRDLLKVALVSITYVFLEWFAMIPASLGWWTNISPRSMFFSIVLGNGALMDTSTTYSMWLSQYLPQIILMITVAIGIIFLDCIVFARMDDL